MLNFLLQSLSPMFSAKQEPASIMRLSCAIFKSLVGSGTGVVNVILGSWNVCKCGVDYDLSIFLKLSLVTYLLAKISNFINKSSIFANNLRK